MIEDRFALVRGVVLYWLRQSELDELLQECETLGVTDQAIHTVNYSFMGLGARAAAPWAAIPALASAVRMGPGTRFGRPPTDEEWNATPEQERARGGRLSRLQRWEHVGDHAVALYDLLSPGVAEERRPRRWGVGPVPATFKRRALKLAARFVSLLYAGTFSKPFKPADVKTRLQARGRRASLNT